MTNRFLMDVLVIGGGPIGLIGAKKCASNGLKTVQVEEHSVIGEPARCAGLLSKRALNESGLSKNNESVLREIRGAYIHSPSQNVLKISDKKTRAFVVDRKIFDKKLSKLAVNQGVELRLNTKAKINRDKVVLNGEKVKPKTVIDSSGYRQLAAKEFNLKPKKILPAIQATIKGSKTLSKEFVELYTGNKWVPGFFAWAIPLKNGARVGLALGKGKNAKKFFNKFLRKHPAGKRLNGEIVSWESGPIPIGPLPKTVKKNILIAGDAAAHAKPTTGGGIYTGTIAAKSCAEAIIKHLNEDKSLKSYEKLWRNKIGTELWIGLKIHNALCKARDKELEELVQVSKEMIPLLREEGDMDHPSKLLFGLRKKPLKALSLSKIYLKTLLPL